MSKKLPFVKSDIPRDLRMFLDRVRELVSGSGDDRLISADELASGVLTGSLVAPTQSFMAAPPSPVDVTATAAVRSIFVEWDAPAYAGHAYAEVWSASTNSLSAAVLLGMAPGSIYVDETGPGATRYYWVRFVNTNDVKGPYNATSGVTATTGPEVVYLLSTLTGSITESQLFADLGSRINLIDGAASLAGSVNARVAAETTARTNAISTEATTRAQAILDEASARSTGDDALQTQIDLLSAAGSGDFSELLAAVESEQSARIAGDAAEAASRQTLAAQLRGDYTGTDPSALTTGLVYNERVTRVSAEGAISSSVTALSSTVTNNYNTLNAAITSEASTRAGADSAISATVTSLSSTVTTNFNTLNAAITSEASTRADIDDAMSATVTALTATVGTNTAAISAEATTRASQTGDLFAKYTVKIDTNGYVSGFGLASTANDDTPFSDFTIRADRFSIASPSGPGITPVVPFVVNTTEQTVNGVTVPAGVYMDAAFIKNGTITNAKIANLAVDNAKIASVSVGKLTAGSIAADQYIQSSNYVAGTSGFRLDANGTAEFGAASIRGQVTAAQIDSRGLSIKDSSGNIILAAGTPLTSSYITPAAGWLNSNVTLGTLGAGAFATLNSITSANASTYIASAAIGSAQVGQLTAGNIAANTITTDKLVVGSVSAANNASTYSNLVYPPATSSNGGYMTGPSVTLTTSGGVGSYVIITITGSYEANIQHTSWNFMSGNITLKVDGAYSTETAYGYALLQSTNASIYRGRSGFSLVYRVTGLSAGSHTFSTEVLFFGGKGLDGVSIGTNWPTGSYVAISNANMVAMENKV